jgi:hypothetical protein
LMLPARALCWPGRALITGAERITIWC